MQFGHFIQPLFSGVIGISELHHNDSHVQTPSTGCEGSSFIHECCWESARDPDGERKKEEQMKTGEGQVVWWKCSGRQAGEDLVQPECFAHAAEMLRSVTSHPIPLCTPSISGCHSASSPLLSSALSVPVFPLLSSHIPF